MNDIEYIYRQDIKDRKSMASGARHVKKGSRSKKCSLLSDYLTASQKKKMNGEVTVYKMNQPITFDEFKSMPKDLQEDYIANLMKTYHVSVRQISLMMQVADGTLSGYVRRYKLNVPKATSTDGKINRMKIPEQKKWEKFCKGEADIKERKMTTVETAEAVATSVETTSSPMKVSDISVSFNGEINFEEIVTYLQLVIGDKPNGTLKISFSTNV